MDAGKVAVIGIIWMAVAVSAFGAGGYVVLIALFAACATQAVAEARW